MDIKERWIDLIHRAATGTMRTRTLLTPLGVLVFTVFVGLFVAAAVWVDRLLRLPGILPDDLRLQISIPIMVTGIAAIAWSGSHFLRVKGTPVPFNPPPEVVSSGPYRYARNPMLTGVFIFISGLGLALDSLSLVVVFMPLFILANVWELKAIEEPELVKRFGDDYEEYRRRTPMFIPRLRRELLGNDHTWVAKALDHRAKIKIEEGDGVAAEAVLRDAFSVGDQGSSEEVGWRHLFLAEAMLARGRAADARIEASTAVELLESSTPEGHWWTAQAKSVLGACMAELGELDAAEGLLVESHRIIDGVKEPGDIFTVESLRRIVRFYQLAGDVAAESTNRTLLDAEQRAWQAQHDRAVVYANGAAPADLALDDAADGIDPR